MDFNRACDQQLACLSHVGQMSQVPLLQNR
jgi:hypothetical protein